MKLSFSALKQPFLFKGVILLSIFFALFVAWTMPSKALGILGGPITSVFYCPCSANLAIVVGPPYAGIFMYEPGFSDLKAFYQIFRPGPEVLGSYVPGGACMMFIPYGCAPMATPIGTIDDLIGVGTSL